MRLITRIRDRVRGRRFLLIHPLACCRGFAAGWHITRDPCMLTHSPRRLLLAVTVSVACWACGTSAARGRDGSSEINPRELAKSGTIYRDAYGMPHMDGKNDNATMFGFGYCQAEDYFWQIEDSYAMGLGRYSE